MGSCLPATFYTPNESVIGAEPDQAWVHVLVWILGVSLSISSALKTFRPRKGAMKTPKQA
jgi:hypothetical protein